MSHDELTVIEVGQRVFGCMGANGQANSGFIYGDESVLLVDAQANPRLADEVRRAVARVTTLPIRHVVCTHHHGDHVFGAQCFPDAEVVAHPLCRAALERFGGTTQPLSRAAVLEIFVGRRAAELIGNDPTHPISCRLAEDDFDDIHVVVPAALDLDVPGSVATIDLGGTVVEIEYLGVAHGQDDVVIWADGRSTLFGGDLAFIDRIPAIASPSIAEWAEVTRALSAMPPSTVLVPGHGPAGSPHDLEQQGAYLAVLEQRAPKTAYRPFASVPGFDRWHAINVAIASLS